MAVRAAPPGLGHHHHQHRRSTDTGSSYGRHDLPTAARRPGAAAGSLALVQKPRADIHAPLVATYQRQALLARQEADAAKAAAAAANRVLGNALKELDAVRHERDISCHERAIDRSALEELRRQVAAQGEVAAAAVQGRDKALQDLEAARHARYQADHERAIASSAIEKLREQLAALNGSVQVLWEDKVAGERRQEEYVACCGLLQSQNEALASEVAELRERLAKVEEEKMGAVNRVAQAAAAQLQELRRAKEDLDDQLEDVTQQLAAAQQRSAAAVQIVNDLLTEAGPGRLIAFEPARRADGSAVAAGEAGMSGVVLRGTAVLEGHDGEEVCVRAVRKPLVVSGPERPAWCSIKEGMVQVLLAIRGNTNVPQLLALEEVGGRLHLVLADRGCDLTFLLSGEVPGMDPRARLDLVLRSSVQLLQQVRDLHRQGLLHADLKEANVLVDAQGVISICDVGLTHTRRQMAAWLRHAGWAAGTAGYYCPMLAARSPDVQAWFRSFQQQRARPGVLGSGASGQQGPQPLRPELQVVLQGAAQHPGLSWEQLLACDVWTLYLVVFQLWLGGALSADGWYALKAYYPPAPHDVGDMDMLLDPWGPATDAAQLLQRLPEGASPAVLAAAGRAANLLQDGLRDMAMGCVHGGELDQLVWALEAVVVALQPQ